MDDNFLSRNIRQKSQMRRTQNISFRRPGMAIRSRQINRLNIIGRIPNRRIEEEEEEEDDTFSKQQIALMNKQKLAQQLMADHETYRYELVDQVRPFNGHQDIHLIESPLDNIEVDAQGRHIYIQPSPNPANNDNQDDNYNEEEDVIEEILDPPQTPIQKIKRTLREYMCLTASGAIHICVVLGVSIFGLMPLIMHYLSKRQTNKYRSMTITAFLVTVVSLFITFIIYALLLRTLPYVILALKWPFNHNRKRNSFHRDFRLRPIIHPVRWTKWKWRSIPKEMLSRSSSLLGLQRREEREDRNERNCSSRLKFTRKERRQLFPLYLECETMVDRLRALVVQVQLQGNNGSIESSTSSDTKPGAIKKGYSLIVAALFVAGENAGCALLALPFCLNNAGWIGMAMIVALCFYAGYAGTILAKCWLIVEERWKEFENHCAYPYPAIGIKAFGRKTGALVTSCVQITLIGSMVVILLLTAGMFHDLTNTHLNISFCWWIVIVSIFLCPLTFLGTPSEFWPAAAGALVTTTLAVLIILSECIYELKTQTAIPARTTPSLTSIFLAFGTVMFGYGGTASFPTFQNDMKDKRKFPLSVMMGFAVLLVLYVPVAALGYITFGEGVANNIMESLPNGIKKSVAMSLMATHLLFAYLLCATAPMQEIENALGAPRRWSWKRPIIRSLVVLLTTFLALSIPEFGKVLDLIGGSTIAMLSFILPPIFYFKLCSMKNPEWPERRVSKMEKFLLIQVLVVGILGGIACTYSAVQAVWGENTFTYPCYMQKSCNPTINSTILTNTTTF